MQENESDVVTEKSLARFFTDSRVKLLNFAQSFVRDRALCEDIVAEAYIQVVGRVRKGKGPAPEKLESYVKVCIRNEAFRQGKRHSHEVPTQFIETLADEMLEVVEDPDHDGTWDEKAAARAFHALSPRSQSVLRLATVEGRRFTDISTRLGISERAVVSAAFRARESLRTRYLVEVTADSHACRETKIEQLASYARDQTSARRREKISTHLQHCSSCDQTVHRMRALRLPALAIVGIAATTGVTLSAHSETAQATEFAPDQPALQTVSPLQSYPIRYIVGGAAVGGLLLAAVLVLMFVQPDSSEPVTQDNTSTQQAQPQDDTSKQSADDKPQNTEAPSPTASSRTPDTSRASVTNDDRLPDGVHSIEWGEAPDNYVAGARDARLLLSVGFDQTGDPQDYDVIITLPGDVSLNRASAGCTADGPEVRCVPPENLVPTNLFRWQFYVDLGDNFSGILPQAQLVKRAA